MKLHYYFWKPSEEGYMTHINRIVAPTFPLRKVPAFSWPHVWHFLNIVWDVWLRTYLPRVVHRGRVITGGQPRKIKNLWLRNIWTVPNGATKIREFYAKKKRLSFTDVVAWKCYLSFFYLQPSYFSEWIVRKSSMPTLKAFSRINFQYSIHV